MRWWEIALIAVGGVLVGAAAAVLVLAYRFAGIWDRAWGYK